MRFEPTKETKITAPYPNVTAPDCSVRERVPEVNELVVAGRQELVLLRVRCQRPDLVDVAGHDLLKVELERALQDRVPGRAE